MLPQIKVAGGVVYSSPRRREKNQVNHLGTVVTPNEVVDVACNGLDVLMPLVDVSVMPGGDTLDVGIN